VHAVRGPRFFTAHGLRVLWCTEFDRHDVATEGELVRFHDRQQGPPPGFRGVLRAW